MKCLLSTALLATLLAAGPAGDDAALIAAQKPCYPLTTCVVSGKPLSGGGGMTPMDIIYEGRLVSFCCSQCPDEFKKSPADFLKKIDDAVIKAQSADYPLDTCPNSGEKLDAKAKVFVVGTKMIKTCCGDCQKEILANPAKALAKLDDAYIAKQEKTYPLTKCPMSDEPLGDKPVKVLYGLQLVEFCCKDCIKDFNKDPKVALAKIAAATSGKPAAPAKKDDDGDEGDEHGEKPHGGH
jgi:YHS domain-containing protein